ncbi:10090_t:CDS:2 [Diversispora eburnea]|uniref:10090_t:CDS:1 n=1 Tax=Diversispora eburnea TaxID=1213867 RepID=A0A9N9CLM2_9GLOM|nr:10090_t:CDS:2 [Diversispora eburnea]
MSDKALLILPTQEEQIKLLEDHATEELLEVYKKNVQVIILVDTMNSDESTLKEKELLKLLNDAFH